MIRERIVRPSYVRRRLEAENGALKGSIETLSGSIKNSQRNVPERERGTEQMPKALTDIRSLARASSRIAISTLTGICGAKDAPPAARVAAAVALLDRGWGKCPQSHTGADGEREILVTIRHLVEGMPDTQQVLDITPEPTFGLPRRDDEQS